MLTGGKKYQIRGCAGQGGFAQVFKAYVNSNPDDVVALKVIIPLPSIRIVDLHVILYCNTWNALQIQKPAFPWEFYMYRQLDQWISEKQVCFLAVFIFYFIYICWFYKWYLFLILQFCQRSSFGFAHRMHLYSDCSILVCDYLSSGTLQVGPFYCVSAIIIRQLLCNTSSCM